MMKRIFSSLFILCLVISLHAQQAKEEIAKNIYLSASNYLAYPGPTQQRLTPPPAGEHPFYISHYGRHGSRYLIGANDYESPLTILSRADEVGKLTPTGKDVLRRVKMLCDQACNRRGELTLLGAQQHKQIAGRMYERFPEVFEGAANIEAKSTIVIRCILSMENELQELLIKNPKLNILHDASEHDMYYMNLNDKALSSKKMPEASKKVYDAFCKKHVKYAHVMGLLFNDTAYVNHQVDASELNFRLFQLASNIQSTELRRQISLYDIFDKDEIYGNWEQENVWWYLNYGACPLNGATQPYSQRNLLRMIIHQADSCIALPKPGATLRFGHETMVLPLTCLLGLNGYDQQISDVEQLEQKGWINYKVFPMGANIQFIFYRKNPGDKDVIFKVLLNENEATLPVKTDIAPYYHWRDFKDYYLKKLDAYKD